MYFSSSTSKVIM